MLRSNSKSLGNHVTVLKKKRKGCSVKDLQKRKVLHAQSAQAAGTTGKMVPDVVHDTAQPIRCISGVNLHTTTQ